VSKHQAMNMYGGSGGKAPVPVAYEAGWVPEPVNRSVNIIVILPALFIRDWQCIKRMKTAFTRLSD
jgi:hypothetical protein